MTMGVSEYLGVLLASEVDADRPESNYGYPVTVESAVVLAMEQLTLDESPPFAFQYQRAACGHPLLPRWSCKSPPQPIPPSCWRILGPRPIRIRYAAENLDPQAHVVP